MSFICHIGICLPLYVIQALESHIMADRMEIAGMETFFSKLDINRLPTYDQHFPFKARMIP